MTCCLACLPSDRPAQGTRQGNAAIARQHATPGCSSSGCKPWSNQVRACMHLPGPSASRADGPGGQVWAPHGVPMQQRRGQLQPA